jgi:hypothetical protein
MFSSTIYISSFWTYTYFERWLRRIECHTVSNVNKIHPVSESSSERFWILFHRGRYPNELQILGSWFAMARAWHHSFGTWEYCCSCCFVGWVPYFRWIKMVGSRPVPALYTPLGGWQWIWSDYDRRFRGIKRSMFFRIFQLHFNGDSKIEWPV